MAETRESTATARVFKIDKGPIEKRGFYFTIEGEEPAGPYKNEIDAGKVARAVIIGRASPMASAGTTCPGVDDCWLRASEAKATGNLAERCTRCPGAVKPVISSTGERRGLIERRNPNAHGSFAGADRRMRDRRRLRE